MPHISQPRLRVDAGMENTYHQKSFGIFNEGSERACVHGVVYLRTSRNGDKDA